VDWCEFYFERCKFWFIYYRDSHSFRLHRTMAAGMIRSSVQAAVATHALLSLASLTYGTGAFGGGSSLTSDDDKDDEVFDAKHYQMVTDLVSDMYSGKGVSHRPHHVILDDKVTFEDPAAICSSRKEVQEAFRALQSVQPQSRSRPKCINVNPKGESIELTYVLNQRYGGGWLDVMSLLVVNVQLAQINGTPESKFVVTKLEERWNGVQPLGSYLFWIVRRINGIVSWNLTTRLISEKKRS
jgi:hypothetical protein